MSKAPAKKWASHELLDMLRIKYPLPQYAFLDQVPDGTSFNKQRTADAIAMGCWSTVGLELNGFEIKVGRGDWIKEIQDPAKSATIQRHCHRWWIVAAPGIVKLEEMPAEWGLMEPVTNGLKVRKAASRLTPEPLTFDFMAAVLRRALSSQYVEGMVRSAEHRSYEKGLEDGKAARNPADDRIKKENDELRQRIDDFEKGAGFILEEWLPGYQGKHFAAFRKFMDQVEYLDRVMLNVSELHQVAVALQESLKADPLLSASSDSELEDAA